MLDAGISHAGAASCAPTASGRMRATTTCRISEASQDRHIVLPLFPGMTQADVDRTAHALQRVVTG